MGTVFLRVASLVHLVCSAPRASGDAFPEMRMTRKVFQPSLGFKLLNPYKSCILYKTRAGQA